MSKPHRLQRINGRYYFRAKVPETIRDEIGKSEIRETLRTSDYREAVTKCRIKSVEVDAMFAAATARTNPERNTELSETLARQLAISWFQEEERRSLARFLEISIDDPEEALRALRTDEAELAQLDSPNVLSSAQGVAESLLGTNHIAAPGDGAPYRFLCHLIQRGMLEIVRRQRERVMGEMDPSGFDDLFKGIAAASPDVSPPALPSLTLKELIERYTDDPARSNLSQKTRDGYATIFRALQELVGADKPIREITREDCRHLRDTIAALPPNAKKRFKGKPLAVAAEIAEAKNLPRISASAANSYLQNLSALFNYAVREQYMETNPAVGLRVAGPKIRKRDRRDAFSTEQLNAIFSAPLYTGCQDDGPGYATPGPNIIRRGRYWVPVLALFHGLRLNEACQLRVEDVTELDDTPVILIREGESADDQRVKTAAGHRLVPVHPEVVKMGFLDFVEEQREAGRERLFWELKLGRHGYYSDPFQKWFGRFLDKAGAKAPRTSFHSFRHCFRDALREADVPRDAVLALGGWTSGGAEEDYGSGLRPSTLAREISKVRYPGLDVALFGL